MPGRRSSGSALPLLLLLAVMVAEMARLSVTHAFAWLPPPPLVGARARCLLPTVPGACRGSMPMRQRLPVVGLAAAADGMEDGDGDEFVPPEERGEEDDERRDPKALFYDLNMYEVRGLGFVGVICSLRDGCAFKPPNHPHPHPIQNPQHM